MTGSVAEKFDTLIAWPAVEKSWDKPQDVSEAVATLARGEAPYPTDKVRNVDGGMTLRRLQRSC